MNCPNHPDRTAKTKGLCGSCYDRDLRERNPEYAERQRTNTIDWLSRPGNKERVAAYQAERQRGRGSRAHRKYRLTREEYEAYLEKPCGVCGGKSIRLDHCHRTGKLRGGLCHRCNLGLGYYEGWFTENKEAVLSWIQGEIEEDE